MSNPGTQHISVEQHKGPLTLTSSTRRLAACSTLAASSVYASSSCPMKWSPRWRHGDVLAAVTGTTLDLLHIIVRGRLGLLVRRTAAGRGRRHHWPLVQARGAYGRRGLCSGRCWDPPFSGWRSRDSVFLPHNVTRGRGPRCLFIPRRGARRGTRRGRLFLDARSSGCHYRLLRGLQRGISNGGYRLSCPLFSDLVGVDIRRHARQQNDI